MLSRLSTALLRSPGVQYRVLNVVRPCTSAAAPGGSQEPAPDDNEFFRNLRKKVKDWDTANEIYFSKERDYKNFPHPVQPENMPPTRMGVIPESWFTAFYEKTGVTGPYVFGAGLTTFLISKEWWIVDHGFVEFLVFWSAMYLLCRKAGPWLKTYANDWRQDYLDKAWYGTIEKNKKACQDYVADVDKLFWYEEGRHLWYEAKRESVALQLEAIYRKRLSEVHQAVKKRLDYQMDLESQTRNIEQTHMVNWIVDSVVKSITPQQEKESLNKCIQDLKAMAARG